MIRFIIMVGFALMFALIHMDGSLNKYINTKYAYLSISAIVLLLLLSLVEVIRLYQQEKKANHTTMTPQECEHPVETLIQHEHEHPHEHDLTHPRVHVHPIDHTHDHTHGHSHGSTSKLRRTIGYLILAFPIVTGIVLPVQTLDSSFVKAKGFSFPSIEESISSDNPGQHQFLKPDTSVFYGSEGYENLKNKELKEFLPMEEILLTDDNYMKGMEVIYNYPGEFMGKEITFKGFAYKGDQVDGDHYFVFRFGFIHCAADSGVFGMLVHFPRGTILQDDDWVEVTGKLSWELYQPFKQKIPVLLVTSWDSIAAPENPYVYRMF